MHSCTQYASLIKETNCLLISFIMQNKHKKNIERLGVRLRGGVGVTYFTLCLLTNAGKICHTTKYKIQHKYTSNVSSI
jgi:hypothetical protein